MSFFVVMLSVESTAKRLGLIGTMAIIGAVPFTLYYLYERPTVSQGYFLELAIPVVALLFFVLKAVQGTSFGRLVIIRTAQDAFVLLYAVIVILSIVQAPYPQYYLRTALFLLCLIVIYFVIINVGLRPLDVDKILFLYIIISLPIALYGILQYFGVEFLGYVAERKVKKLIVLSFLGHPNYIASFLVPLIFINLIFLLSKKSSLVRIICAGSIILIITCIILGGTRAGWVSLIVGLLILFLALRGLGYYARHFKKMVIVLLAFFAIIFGLVLTPNPLLPSKYDMWRRITSTGEMISRLYGWQIGWEMIKDKPILGVGYGGFTARYWDYVDEFQKRPENKIFDFFNARTKGIPPGQAHNEYIEIAAETGLLGLAAFWLILIAFFDRLLRRIKARSTAEQDARDRLGEERLYLSCIGGAVLSMLVDGLFGFPFQLPCSGLVFWVLLALGTYPVAANIQQS